MGKTLSITLSTVYSKNTVNVMAKQHPNDSAFYIVSKRQLKAAERRIGMIGGDRLTVHGVPECTDWWTWHADGSLSIKRLSK